MSDEIQNETEEIIEAKVEKIDMNVVRNEQEKTKFQEKIEQLLNDKNFFNVCEKYLKIKDSNK